MQQMTAIAITRPGGPEVLQPVKLAAGPVTPAVDQVPAKAGPSDSARAKSGA